MRGGDWQAAVGFVPAHRVNVRARLANEPVLSSVAALSNNDTHQLTDMEVADQWRREWAGTAEYGKVRLKSK